GLTVNFTPPAPVAGNTGPLCLGSAAALNLTASTVTGASYSWTGPNGFTSSSQNPSISTPTEAALGTYSVTATIGSCTSTAATTTVSATIATPTAGNSGPIYASQTLSLTASLVTGATYSWTGPNGFTSSLRNPSIANATTAASGVYKVRAIVSGCSSA